MFLSFTFSTFFVFLWHPREQQRATHVFLIHCVVRFGLSYSRAELEANSWAATRSLPPVRIDAWPHWSSVALLQLVQPEPSQSPGAPKSGFRPTNGAARGRGARFRVPHSVASTFGNCTAIWWRGHSFRRSMFHVSLHQRARRGRG